MFNDLNRTLFRRCIKLHLSSGFILRKYVLLCGKIQNSCGDRINNIGYILMINYQPGHLLRWDPKHAGMSPVSWFLLNRKVASWVAPALVVAAHKPEVKSPENWLSSSNSVVMFVIREKSGNYFGQILISRFVDFWTSHHYSQDR